MNVLEVLGSIVSPVTTLIDELHTSEEEKMALKHRMLQLQAKAYSEVLDFEKASLKAKADIVKAEAQGGSWMQRSWRPITMLTFLVLVVMDSFGLLAFRLSEEAWSLLQIGLGGYVVGRSAEKLAPVVTNSLGGK